MKKIVLIANYCIYIMVLAINLCRRNIYIITLQGKCVTMKMSITYENTQSLHCCSKGVIRIRICH